MLRILHLLIQTEDKPKANETLDNFKKELNSSLLKLRNRCEEVEIEILDSQESAMTLIREPRIYWFKGKRKTQKDTLIFDAGYEDGQIYVYKLEEPLEGEELEEQVRRYGQPVCWRILKEI